MNATQQITAQSQPAQAAMPFDVAALHRKHERQIRATLYKRGVNPVESDDAYADTLTRIISLAPAEYSAERASPSVYAHFKARESAERYRNMQMRNQQRYVLEMHLRDHQEENARTDDTVECLDAAHVESDAGFGLALESFLGALTDELPAAEQTVLNEVGFDGLTLNPEERASVAARLGIPEDTLRKRMLRIRKKIAEIWADHFSAPLPDRVLIAAGMTTAPGSKS